MKIDCAALLGYALSMGRPALHLMKTVISISKETADRIDQLVGKKRRSVFIREAIERELARRERASKKTDE